MTTTQGEYVLGSSRRELDRLDVQADYYARATVDAMRWAGIEAGMDVLDIGSGTGAVAFTAARLVGPTGSVLGLDASEQAVAAARENAARLGLGNVRFERADLTGWTAERQFDALTGRLILMYLPDPPATIAALCTALRPGAPVLMQEFSISHAQQRPQTELFRQTLAAVISTFQASGAPTDLGLLLGRIMRAAGLPTPAMALGGQWEDGSDATAYALLAGVARTMRAAIAAHGIMTEAELDIDTLEARLRAAGADSGATASLLISAWSRVPG